MAATAVMTVRIDPALLAALRVKARREGRTVSAEVIRLVKREVAPLPARRGKPTRTMGMFADFEAPELTELVGARRQLSGALRRSVAARAKRRA